MRWELVLRLVLSMFFLSVVLSSSWAGAYVSELPIPDETYPGIDRYHGIVCSKNYCTYRRFGLRWAISEYGESTIWKNDTTRYIKIGLAYVADSKAKGNFVTNMFSNIRVRVNPLLLKKGYYFKYCDAVTKVCERLGNKEYYTASELEKLFIPVMETRRTVPVDIAGKAVERRNDIVLAFLGIAGSSFMALRMNFTGTITAAFKTLGSFLAAVLTGRVSEAKEIGKTLWKATDPGDAASFFDQLNRAPLKVLGAAGIVYFSYRLIKSWRLFSSGSYAAGYYTKSVKVPLFMSIPDMYVKSRQEKLSIETIKESIDSALKGELGEFISTYESSSSQGSQLPGKVEDE